MVVLKCNSDAFSSPYYSLDVNLSYRHNSKPYKTGEAGGLELGRLFRNRYNTQVIVMDIVIVVGTFIRRALRYRNILILSYLGLKRAAMSFEA